MTTIPPDGVFKNTVCFYNPNLVLEFKPQELFPCDVPANNFPEGTSSREVLSQLRVFSLKFVYSVG